MGAKPRYPVREMVTADVLAVIALLVGVGGTAWAMTVSMGLLFPEGARRAGEATRGAFVRGLLPFAAGLFGLGVSSVPFPGAKLLGLFLVLAVLALASLGLAGLARVAGRRITMLQPGLGEYPAFLRGAGFLVAACLFPLLGWFLFAPALFVVALGAGASALLARDAAVEA